MNVLLLLYDLTNVKFQLYTTECANTIKQMENYSETTSFTAHDGRSAKFFLQSQRVLKAAIQVPVVGTCQNLSPRRILLT